MSLINGNKLVNKVDIDVCSLSFYLFDWRVSINRFRYRWNRETCLKSELVVFCGDSTLVVNCMCLAAFMNCYYAKRWVFNVGGVFWINDS